YPPATSAAKQSFAPVGSQPPYGSEGNASVSSQPPYGNEGTGAAAGSGGVGLGSARGNGHGHPSAMRPSFPGGEGGTGYPDNGGATGSGFQGTGTLVLRGMGSGGGLGSSSSGDGSPSGSSSDLPGLGPPRALSSTPGEGYPGGGAGRGAIAGTGLIGN